MDERSRTRVFFAAAVLLVAALACGLPTPTPEPPTPTVYVPPEPTTPPGEASPTSEPPPEPSPMPEGELLVAYTRDDGLWIVEGEAAPRRLTADGSDTDPRFSPDGQWVLFRRELPPGPAGLPRLELRVVGVDGSGERRLVGPEDLPGEMGTPMGSDSEVLLDRLPFQIEWLPDSGAVAFNTHVEYGYGLLTSDDLWSVDVATGALTPLLADEQGGTFAFSADGTRVVVATPTQVAMIDADGANRRTLVSFDRVNTASEYAFEPLPVWAPDGSYALVVIPSPEPFAPGASGGVWRLPVSGDAVLLATLPGNFLFGGVYNSLWSPDRARLAYTRPAAGADPNARELVIGAVDGSDSTVYTTGNVDFLGWAPDGLHFTFWQNQPVEVMLGTLGEPPLALVPPGEGQVVGAPIWADDEVFVYMAGEAGAFAVRAGQLGGASRVLDLVGDSVGRFDAYR
jgi:dipeptidyl aminopeptidase/acylaminoacyl peptidase